MNNMDQMTNLLKYGILTSNESIFITDYKERIMKYKDIYRDVDHNNLFDLNRNEYHTKTFYCMMLRADTIEKYGWCCPTVELIENIKKLLSLVSYNKIYSIGSGLGLIEYLLYSENTKIECYDSYEDREIKKSHIFYIKPIKAEGINVVKNCEYNDILLLIWPREFAGNILENFKGKILIYIGEGCDGCCADTKFFRQLTNDWLLIKEIKLPDWERRISYNACYILVRKKKVNVKLEGKQLKNRKRNIRRYNKYNKELLN